MHWTLKTLIIIDKDLEDASYFKLHKYTFFIE